MGEVVELLLALTDTEWVSFSGGEPFTQAAALAEVAGGARCRERGLIFTGFEADALLANHNPGVQRLLAAADFSCWSLPARSATIASAACQRQPGTGVPDRTLP